MRCYSEGMRCDECQSVAPPERTWPCRLVAVNVDETGFPLGPERGASVKSPEDAHRLSNTYQQINRHLTIIYRLDPIT